MVRCLLASLLLVLAGSAAAVEEPDPGVADHPEVKGALAIVDAWVEALGDYDDIPGISLGLVADQDLFFARGYGQANRRRNVAADADTIYSICSISKLFTSIAVMQQRDAGQLTLRDPVTRHLPWFDIEERHQAAGPARIHGLLTHSAGLPREVDFPYWVEKFPFPDREAMMARIPEQETLYPADTLFQYSNLGLTLAGEVVAAVSGQSYADYVNEQILAPLGMADTRPYFPEKLHGRKMAVGYTGQNRDGKRSAVPPFDTQAIAPAAGFTSTVNDLAAFARWQFRILEEGGDEVLDANTLREMQRVHWVDEDWKSTWGLGFVVGNADGTTLVGHGGSCPGYQTSLLLLPKHKVAAIALTNASDAPAYTIARNMLSTVGPALRKAGQGNGNGAEADAADHNLEEYAGNYGNDVWGGESAIRVWGDKLAALRLPQDKIDNVIKLKHVEADRFVRVTDDGDEREAWVFSRDGDGVVNGLERHSQKYKRLN